MAEPVRRIGWAERWDGAVAGLFFGAVGAVVHLNVTLIFGVVGWWRDSTETFGQFFLAQLVYSLVIIIGVALLGALWDLRKSRSGRTGLWLLGALIVSGAMLSLLKAPVWKWDIKTWGWLLVMTPAFAWVLGSGKTPSRRP
jgi:hypothetical protein